MDSRATSFALATECHEPATRKYQGLSFPHHARKLFIIVHFSLPFPPTELFLSTVNTTPNLLLRNINVRKELHPPFNRTVSGKIIRKNNKLINCHWTISPTHFLQRRLFTEISGCIIVIYIHFHRLYTRVLHKFSLKLRAFEITQQKEDERTFHEDSQHRPTDRENGNVNSGLLLLYVNAANKHVICTVTYSPTIRGGDEEEEAAADNNESASLDDFVGK